MQNSFVIDANSRSTFKNKTLLLDTNALIDAFRLPAEFYDLANEFATMGCDLVTTKTIALEFLGGTKDKSSIKIKQEFLELTFGKKLAAVYLPLDHTEPDISDILTFSRQANKFSIADYELYSTCKRYGERIALVTRNHKDFSAKLMERISFITLLGNAEIHTYGIYSYSG